VTTTLESISPADNHCRHQAIPYPSSSRSINRYLALTSSHSSLSSHHVNAVNLTLITGLSGTALTPQRIPWSLQLVSLLRTSQITSSILKIRN